MTVVYKFRAFLFLPLSTFDTVQRPAEVKGLYAMQMKKNSNLIDVSIIKILMHSEKRARCARLFHFNSHL